MNAHHTQGPWYLDDNESGLISGAHLIHDGDLAIAHIEQWDGDGSDSAEALEAYANARLIAAAPDLLAALHSLRDAIIVGDPQTIADALHRDALPAIAKASVKGD